MRNSSTPKFFYLSTLFSNISIYICTIYFNKLLMNSFNLSYSQLFKVLSLNSLGVISNFVTSYVATKYSAHKKIAIILILTQSMAFTMIRFAPKGLKTAILITLLNATSNGGFNPVFDSYCLLFFKEAGMDLYNNIRLFATLGNVISGGSLVLFNLIFNKEEDFAYGISFCGAIVASLFLIYTRTLYNKFNSNNSGNLPIVIDNNNIDNYNGNLEEITDKNTAKNVRNSEKIATETNNIGNKNISNNNIGNNISNKTYYNNTSNNIGNKTYYNNISNNTSNNTSNNNTSNKNTKKKDLQNLLIFKKILKFYFTFTFLTFYLTNLSHGLLKLIFSNIQRDFFLSMEIKSLTTTFIKISGCIIELLAFNFYRNIEQSLGLALTMSVSIFLNVIRMAIFCVVPFESIPYFLRVLFLVSVEGFDRSCFMSYSISSNKILAEVSPDGYLTISQGIKYATFIGFGSVTSGLLGSKNVTDNVKKMTALMFREFLCNFFLIYVAVVLLTIALFFVLNGKIRN